MKEFMKPEVEIVYFNQKDIITESPCPCVQCGVCPEGDHCPKYDEL